MGEDLKVGDNHHAEQERIEEEINFLPPGGPADGEERQPVQPYGLSGSPGPAIALPKEAPIVRDQLVGRARRRLEPDSVACLIRPKGELEILRRQLIVETPQPLEKIRAEDTGAAEGYRHQIQLALGIEERILPAKKLQGYQARQGVLDQLRPAMRA